MVTINKQTQYNPVEGKYDIEFKGLSTDTKPTSGATNSLFLELDTGDVYYFNSGAWIKVGA